MELYVNFSDILQYFKRNWLKFLLTVLILGVVCGLLPLKLASYMYSTNTTVMINCQVPENADKDFRQQYTGILSYRVQAAIAEASSNDLLEKTADALHLDKKEIKKITGEQVKSAPAVKLTVQTSNAKLATKIADTAADILGKDLVQQFPSPKLSTFIVEKAQDTEEDSQKAAMVKGAVLGALLGFILFVCYGLIRVLSNHVVRKSATTAELLGLKCLGEIPHNASSDARADAFRRMRTRLLVQDKTVKSYLMVAVGKDSSAAAQTAAGLASSLAQAGKKTLLIEANLRNSQLPSLWKVTPSHSLRDLLQKKCSLQQTAMEIPNCSGLFLLAGSNETENPADLLAAEFDRLLQEAESTYDRVVICAPSQTLYPDADSITAFADAVLLTAKYGVTSYADMQNAVRSTQETGGKLLGFVVTEA